MLEHVEKTANDFSKFIMIDMENKLQPINKSIDDMLARLEEFQTMICFSKQERINATNFFLSIEDGKEELYNLFDRIDAVEKLVEHVKSTLNSLEANIEKAEEELGYPENKTNKVTNIFTPLFKKTSEKKSPTGNQEFYKTSDYFYQ